MTKEELAKANYESACACDRQGKEEEAIPYYQKALDLGLSGQDRTEALLGLGSSLRNVGKAREAVVLLENAQAEFKDFIPLRAFCALARWSVSKDKKELANLRTILQVGQLGGYEKAVRMYLQDAEAHSAT